MAKKKPTPNRTNTGKKIKPKPGVKSITEFIFGDPLQDQGAATVSKKTIVKKVAARVGKNIFKRVVGGVIPGVGLVLLAKDANAVIDAVEKKQKSLPKRESKTTRGKSGKGRKIGGRR